MTDFAKSRFELLIGWDSTVNRVSSWDIARTDGRGRVFEIIRKGFKTWRGAEKWARANGYELYDASIPKGGKDKP